MATWPSASKASTANLDSGTDSPAAARADIKTNVDNVNEIIDMFNIATPSDNQILKYNSTNSRFELATDAGGISDVVADTTPQLGGNLDVNGNSIVSTSNGNIALAPNGTGKVVLSGVQYPTVNGTDGQVLTTNGSGVASWATPAGGGGAKMCFLTSSSQSLISGSTYRVTMTETADPENIVTLGDSNRQFTLAAGTYIVIPSNYEFSIAENYPPTDNIIYNVTDSSTTISQANLVYFSQVSNNMRFISRQSAFTIAASKTFEYRFNNVASPYANRFLPNFIIIKIA